MSKKIFVNLPIKNVKATRAFFGALGFEFNEQFSSDDTTCMVISNSNFAMFLEYKRFGEFTPAPRQIADATKTTEVLIALSLDSKEAVDIMVDKALELGGTEPRPKQDLGFMYSRAMADLDGHIWEPFFMDVSGFEPATP